MKKRFISIVTALALVLSTAGFGFAQDVNPKDDFYAAVNAKWMSENPIPEGYSSWSNFMVLNKKVSDDLRGIIEDYNSKKATLKDGSEEKKLVDFYNTALDLKSRNSQGIKPIESALNIVNETKEFKDLHKSIINLNNEGFSTMLHYSIMADLKDSDLNALYVDGPGIGLGEKNYYMGNDENTLKIQKAYKEYLSKLFILKGDSKEVTEKKAESVFNFEKEIASVSLSSEEARDIQKQYNIYTLDELSKLAPNMNISDLIKSLKLDQAKKIIVSQPEVFKKTNTLLSAENMENIKAYLEAVVLRSSADALTSDFEKASFEFSKVFTGIDKMLPENERAFNALNSSLGEMLGKIYVQKYFSEDAKKDVKDLVQSVIKTYEKRIKALDWMSDATKEKAIVKLNSLTIKVGYPDKWNDFSSVDIKSFENGGSYFENIKAIANYYDDKAIASLSQKVDKAKWEMTPQTINAYYNPSINEIVFPAAILQSPFYTFGGSRVANLGGIGAVIGHEISHGFDDQGSMFDEKGNMVNWWTKEDYENYAKKTQALSDQYSKFEVFPNEFINGKLTLGENIADLGGVSAALEAAKQIEGVDLDEFFKSYAKVWRINQKEERARFLLKTDPHSPGKFRVNGILTNIDDFYKQYNVQNSDKMYTAPENRIKIW